MPAFCSRLVFALAFVILFSGISRAEGFALYEYSARGVALGGAVVARNNPDASAVAYNPAMITKLKGVHLMAGLSAITPMGKIDTVDASGNEATTALRPSTWGIPHAYYTHQINDSFTFGIGEFTRYGLGFEYPHNWPGRFNIYEVSLLSASLNPNIAWAVSDKLSFAVGAEIVYVSMDMKKRVDAEGVLPPAMGGFPYSFEVDSNIQNASDTGLGWNAALHYQFNDQWSAGFLYRSQVRVHAKGEVEYSMVESRGTPAVDERTFKNQFRDGKAHSTVILPDSFTGGIAFAPIPDLSFELSATYTRWSSFRDLNIHLPQPIGESRNRKHWDDAWRIGVGVEYAALPWLTLRGGYVFDQSPMGGKYQDYLVPTNDRDIWSLGVGLTMGSWTVDLTYAFIDAKSRIYSASSETNVLHSRTHESNCTHIASISVGYSF